MLLSLKVLISTHDLSLIIRKARAVVRLVNSKFVSFVKYVLGGSSSMDPGDRAVTKWTHHPVQDGRKSIVQFWCWRWAFSPSCISRGLHHGPLHYLDHGSHIILVVLVIICLPCPWPPSPSRSQEGLALGRGARASWLLMSLVLCTSPLGIFSGALSGDMRGRPLEIWYEEMCWDIGMRYIGPRLENT